MPPPSLEFEWRSSPAHVDLLSKFASPRDITQVFNWQYLRQSLNEDTSKAIDRFIKTGRLVPCDLREIIERALNVADF
jgi:hypothetical protein